MKTILIAKRLCLLLFSSLIPVFVFANPLDEGNYTDYLPRYRQVETYYQIDKIEHLDKRTILYFRYVVQENGQTTFFSSASPEAWYLRTHPRADGLRTQFNLLEVQDIQINNQLKTASFGNSSFQISYDAKKGDVVSCQLHFVRVSRMMKIIDLVGGIGGDRSKAKRNCFDIFIKSKDSPSLGDQSNSELVVSSFEYKNTGIASNLSLAKNKPAQPDSIGLGRAINYYPQQLNSIDDIVQNERIILPRITFEDNENYFESRVKAIQDIKILYRYLKYFPEAKMSLHGHTDVCGDAAKNLDLSRERAAMVKRELVRMGINRERIKVYYHGGMHPLLPITEKSSINRRVEAEIIVGQKVSDSQKGGLAQHE